MIKYPKNKKIKVCGAAARKLNEAIHERDSYKCIFCGAYVPIGEKYHHVKHGAYKTDTMDNGVLLCYICHTRIHIGKPKQIQDISRQCEEYLAGIYGGDANGSKQH